MTNPTIDIISSICSKTIGFDLVPTKGLDSWKEVLDKEKEYEEKGLLHLSTKSHKLPEYYEGARNYKPNENEIKVIIECINNISHPNDYLNNLDKYDIRLNRFGNILVRTPEESWYCLAGREWLVDINNKIAKLVCMS